MLQLVGYTPKDYSHNGDPANEPLYTSESVLHGSDWYDGGPLSGLEGDKEEYPDEENGDDTNGESDEEPDTPARLGTHVLKCNNVLRRGNGGGCATNIGSESYT